MGQAGLWLSPGPKPLFAVSPRYIAMCPSQPAGLPFLTDVTQHLSSEPVHIIQNYILRVPDNDSELTAEGCIGGFSDS